MLDHLSYNDRYRTVFSLQAKNGGLSFLLPGTRANEHERSFRICEPLQNHKAKSAEILKAEIRRKVRKVKQEQARAKTLAIKERINEKEAYFLDLASEKRASRWLSALPLKRYLVVLTRRYSKNEIALSFESDPIKVP